MAAAEVPFCRVRVGELSLLFEPQAIRTIEGVYEGAADEVPTLDLRAGLGLPAGQHAESLVVSSAGGALRLVVCSVDQILRSELRVVHPVPLVLRGYCRRLGLRGVVELNDTLAYLAQPGELGEALRREDAA